MHLPTLTLALLSLSLVTANAPPHHRHLGKGPLGKRHTLERRAGGAISNDTINAMPSDEANMWTHGAAAEATSSTATSSAAGESGKAGDIVTPSTAQTSSSTVQPTTSSTSTTDPVETPSAVQSSTETQETQAAPSSTSEQPSVAPSSSDTPSAVGAAPQTLSSVSPTSAATRVLTSQRNTYVTMTRTASGSSTASVAASNADDTKEKSSGLSKTALIAIIVVASVVGAGVIAVFAVRKFKLRKSNRFDDRMKPIDFSPHNDGMGNDDFLEKTLQRTASNASADRQRQQFVKELEADPNYVAGVPDHDFTAGAAHNNAGYGAYDDGYNNDPFARAQMYEYDQNAYYQDDPHAYPPAAGQHVDYGHAAHAHDYPTQDQPQEGYADLQRGNSNGSDHARSAGGHVAPQQYTDFPSPDNYLGRPTGGIDSPYAQAAQYRSY